MSYRSEPDTAEAVIADLLERVRRMEGAMAALPREVFLTNPVELPPPLATGVNTGDLLVWNNTTKRWGVLARGTPAQRLVVDISQPLKLRWVT